MIRRKWDTKRMTTCVVRYLTFPAIVLLPKTDSGTSVHAAGVGQGISSTRVLVVRHAEDLASNNPNTNLDPDRKETGIGISRAARLAERAKQARVAAIYTTEVCRTAQTVQPAAQALRLTVRVLADDFRTLTLGECTPPITVRREHVTTRFNDAVGFAQLIRKQHAGTTVLVAGHTSTVPLIVEALVGESLCPEHLTFIGGACEIPEDRFGDLFVVTIPGDGGRPTVARESY